MEEQRWRNVSVPRGGLESLRRAWLREDLASFNAFEAIQSNATRYLRLKNEFIQAYISLMNEREIIQKWIDEDRLGRKRNRMDYAGEREEISGVLRNIREVQFFFERVYYRLDQLIRQYPSLAGDSEITAGLSLRNFYRQFEEDGTTLRRRTGEVWYILKLYQLREG